MTRAGKFGILVSTALLIGLLVYASPSQTLNDADSYAVYSALMNSETHGKADKGLWMLSASTTVYEAAHACAPNLTANDDQSVFDLTTSPQASIHVPPEDKVRFREVLDDFEKNCHERGSLRADLLKTDWPVRMLTAQEEKQYKNDLAPENPEPLKKWPHNAAGLQSFSRVFFNHDHTLAMVYSSFYCGMLCATWEWKVLERTNSGWVVLPWKIDTMVS